MAIVNIHYFKVCISVLFVICTVINHYNLSVIKVTHAEMANEIRPRLENSGKSVFLFTHERGGSLGNSRLR